jgi:manganese transport protein
MLKKLFKNIGPGTLVAAAFIGPGTVTVCTLAGVRHSFTLLWAMLLSIIATMVLQEMAARLGLVTKKGLAANVKEEVKHPFIKWGALLLIVAAILIGNAAYEAGNISGGMLGLQTIFPDASISVGDLDLNPISFTIGLLAFIVLFIGNYKVIERSLVGLVLLMSSAFLITALMTAPNILSVLKGLFIPVIPEGGILMVIALVGTTVVPYNLFLHAALVSEKWESTSDLKAVRKDLYLSIALGGMVSMSIIICGASISDRDVDSAVGLAKGLEPLLGSFATYFLSIGLFAAGITSAITAPLAAAYVARDCFGWKASLSSLRFRTVWIAVLFLGVIFSSIGLQPIEIITFAQVANGILLPIIAIFLVWVTNRKAVLGEYKNTLFQKSIGILIVITAMILGGKSLYGVFF